MASPLSSLGGLQEFQALVSSKPSVNGPLGFLAAKSHSGYFEFTKLSPLEPDFHIFTSPSYFEQNNVLLPEISLNTFLLQHISKIPTPTRSGFFLLKKKPFKTKKHLWIFLAFSLPRKTVKNWIPFPEAKLSSAQGSETRGSAAEVLSGTILAVHGTGGRCFGSRRFSFYIFFVWFAFWLLCVFLILIMFLLLLMRGLQLSVKVVY